MKWPAELWQSLLKPYEDDNLAALYLQVSHVSAIAYYSLCQCMIYGIWYTVIDVPAPCATCD